ncbi:MAG: outer membrane beta-barrel protein [Saprospiraceae bacterium]|nr:outer membrane beta-barrel protein [Saprospiraceae bacterium]
MKNILLAAALFLGSFSYLIGQKHGIGLMGGFDYTHRFLINDSDDPTIEFIFNKRTVEKGKANYQYGINYRYNISENLALISGFKLSSVGYRDKKFDDLLWPSEVDPETGQYTPDPSLPHESQFHYDYWMLTIPARIRRTFGEGKVRFYAEGGIAAGYYSSTRSTETTDVFKRSNFFVVDDFRKINLSLDLGLGISFRIWDDVEIYAQPGGRYYFTRLVAGAPIKEYLYSVGLEAGFVKFFGSTQQNQD